MCGICGLFAPPGAGAPDRAAADAMLDAIRHRGPDDGASTPLGACVLGHRRLRVIDLETGEQPVTDESGEIVAVFNGEIYNFQALRQELAANGHQVRGTGDTPIIPHLYEEHGERFVERMHGMFALALWDGRNQRLVLARDRVGKKPLLWTRLADGTLAFASELKALLRLPGVSRELDLAALDALLALQYVPGPGTALRGVHKLQPGHVLVADADGERIERYWAPRRARGASALGGRVARARPRDGAGVRAQAARRRRPARRAPVGRDRLEHRRLADGAAAARAGADLLGRLRGRPLRRARGRAARRGALRHGARGGAARAGRGGAAAAARRRLRRAVRRLLRPADVPRLGGRAARASPSRWSETAATRPSAGTSATRRTRSPRDSTARCPPASSAPGARSLRALPTGRSELRSPVVRAARFLDAAGADSTERYGRLMEIFPASLRRSLWTEDALAQIGSPPSAGRLLGPPSAPGITGLQLLDIATYLPGDLLYKADIASMACSLELRAPFLDHEVIELGLALPDSLKSRGKRGKVALRRAFAADLPPEILGLGKRGFGVPVAQWFRTDLRELAGDVLLGERASSRGLFRRAAVETLLTDHVAGRADNGARLWSLVMLELWQQEYVDVTAVPAAALATAR